LCTVLADLVVVSRKDGKEKRKGASAEERRTRLVTHCLHVQFLLFHGAVRNRWLCDAELQAILLSQVVPGLMAEVERFQKKQGKQSGKGLADPALKLLGVMVRWWRRRFTVDRPGLRKNGYKEMARFEEEKVAEGEKFLFTTGRFGRDGEEVWTVFQNRGERVESLEDFKTMAKECRGSRDTGAMLFTALLRALGFEVRMVFSIQPLGFGFTERERFEMAGRRGGTGGKKQMPVAGKPMRKRRHDVGPSSSGQESGDNEDCDSDDSRGGGFARQKRVNDQSALFSSHRRN
jgi:xeroderma pigmentosum group C-complementing protein